MINFSKINYKLAYYKTKINIFTNLYVFRFITSIKNQIVILIIFNLNLKL